MKAMKSILRKGALGKAKANPVPVGKFAALAKAKEEKAFLGKGQP